MAGSLALGLKLSASGLFVVAVVVGCNGSSERKSDRRGTGGASASAGTQGGADDPGGHGGASDNSTGGSSDNSTGGSSGDSTGGSSTGGVAGAMGGTLGGQASGGQTSGSGGSAGQGGQPSLPLPDGCVPRMASEDASTCRLGLFCGSTPNLVNCRTVESGNWQCSCELSHNERVYEIDGATGIRACAIAGGLCAEDDLELGDEECLASVDTSSADGCTLELSCGRPISVSFASGVDARLMEYGSATCVRAETGEHFECTCEHDDARVQHAVLADSGTLACRPLVDFCIDETEPTFDGPTTCLEPGVHTAPDYCRAHQTCAKSIPLTDSVSLAQMAMRYATCETPDTTGSGCYCSTQAGLFDFEIDAEPVAASCASSVLNCAEGASIETTGGVDCQPTSQSASRDDCQVDLACSQPATVDARQIVANGRLQAYCRRADVGEPWWCSCASNQDTTIFELGAATSAAWEVCATAPDRCLERMPVFIGLYGSHVAPPDPLPPQ